MQPRLQAVHISKVFPGVNALTDVSVDFYPGEVHALMGENGAGKSTLIKILSGVYTPTEGQIFLDGKEIAFKGPRDALDQGISVIHQELSIAKDLSVAENIFLGEEKKKGLFLDNRQMHRQAAELLRYMKVDQSIRATDIAGNLTAAQQQMVEIAKVLNKKAKVVIMDEPTSSLSEREINALFEQIHILRHNNVAIVYITHRLKEIFQMCDRVTVLRDGCHVRTDMLAEVSEQELVSSMVGREIKDYFIHMRHDIGEEMLRVEGLSRGKEFRDVSFTVRKGEILGIAGLVGAGRTEVMETIFGARTPEKGKIFVEGREARFASPKDAIAQKIGMVTEDRRTTGLMLKAMVKDNKVLPSLIYHRKALNFVDEKWIREVSREYVGKLRVKTPGIDAYVQNLSGGNQQKVVLGKWLIANSRILILDEPTRGIDVNAKTEFYGLMNDFVASGGCIVMVSSELPEVLGVADRILVMREGRVSGELSREEASEQAIIHLASHTSDTAAV
ncbi:MAG: sugar ABC transporter ATP-binding protein [Candidatus Limiplasma sp.]|nr:sugar ABC transporter ATP-binding protein [Candidatus Limiplasma sp.]